MSRSSPRRLPSFRPRRRHRSRRRRPAPPPSAPAAGAGLGVGAGQHARAADGQLEALAAHLSRSARRAAARRGRPPRTPRSRGCRRTLMATLPSASRNSRSRIMREVTFLPFAAGQRAVVDRKVIASVGGSTGMAGMRRCTSGAPIVSARSSSRPAIGDDVAGLGALDRHAVEAAEGQQLGHPCQLDHRAVGVSTFTAMFIRACRTGCARSARGRDRGRIPGSWRPCANGASRSPWAPARGDDAGRTAAPGPCARPRASSAAQPCWPEA